MYKENPYYQNLRSIIFRNYKEEVQEEVNVEWLFFRRETASGFCPFGDAIDLVRGRR